MDDSPRDSAPSPAAPGATHGDTRPAAAPRAPLLAFIVALVAVALAAWQWYDARTREGENRMAAGQAREAVAEVRAKLGALESQLAESRKQQAALEAMYQELSRNRDEWTYAEIEQSLFVASQQLQLAGNVKMALIALQTADARLRRLERPQLTALRKAINRDIDRLKAAPQVDTLAISARLDGLLAKVDGLALAMDARPRPEQPAVATPEPEGNMWTRFWHDAWREMKQLIRVQQLDKPEHALLAPSQAYFLRENLKLRLVGARVALLARDAASYKVDLKAARDLLGRYYNTGDNDVRQALMTLRSLQEVEPGIEPPDIGATLEAMRSVRAARERGGR